MLYKHDSVVEGEKKPSALSQHSLKESAVVLHDPFLLMLYWCVADKDTVNCHYRQTRLIG